MDNILKYHIEDTKEKLLEIKEDIEDLTATIEDLKEFKIQLVATSRLTSLIVSAICGFVTLAVSTLVAVKFK